MKLLATLLLLVSSAATQNLPSKSLGDRPWDLGLFAGQLAFYLASYVVARLPARLTRFKPLRLTTMFTGMNAALLVGFCGWLWGGQTGTWKPTARAAEVERVGS